MKIHIQIFFLLIFFNNAIVAQPGWSQIGGQLNNISKTDIENCLNTNCKIKYITIDSTTDLSRLYLLKNLKSLALKLDLVKLPPNFSELTNLENLIITNSNIANISELSNLPNLKTLILLNNKGTGLPKGIELLNNFTELEITGNFFNANGIENLVNLKKLKLSSPNLTSLPEFNFKNNITSLDLYCTNELFNYRNLYLLNNLKTIYLYESAFKTFPNNLTKTIQDITIFRAEQLTDISNLELYHELKKLYIYSTAIDKLPSETFLTKIPCINIFQNKKLKVEDKKSKECNGIYQNGQE